MVSGRSVKFAAAIFLMLLPLLSVNAYSKEKPDIIRCDVQYLDMLVRIHVQWQSLNPITFVRAIVGKEQKEVKIDEYDNRRNPGGYGGEATIVINVTSGKTQDGIPYVIQIEDELRQKSDPVTGNVKTFAGTGNKKKPVGVSAGGGSQPEGGFSNGGGEPTRPMTGLIYNLQNDNFVPGGRVAFPEGLKAGDEVAVVLGPVELPYQVTKIAFLCGGSTESVGLTLKISRDMGEANPGTPLFTGKYTIQGSNTTIQEIDLTGKIGTIPGGNIRVSFQFQHSGLPSIGYDPSESEVPKRNWVFKSGNWTEFGAGGLPGNGIVRATAVTP